MIVVRVVLSVDPPVAAGDGVLVGADNGGVDLDEPVDVAGRVHGGLDLLRGSCERTVQRVVAEGALTVFMWAKT